MQCTVVIPTFRDARIAQALDSIASQKNIQLEVVIVDGANEPAAFQSLPSYPFPITFIHVFNLYIFIFQVEMKLVIAQDLVSCIEVSFLK